MDAPFLFVDKVETTGRRCLVRLDLNVPLADGRVTDDTRIRRILPGLDALRKSGARLVLLTHLGRPKGRVAPEFSVAPVAEHLAALLGCPVPVEPDLLGQGGRDAVAALADGDVVMMENLRFHEGEEAMIRLLRRRLPNLAISMLVMLFPAPTARMRLWMPCRA